MDRQNNITPISVEDVIAIIKNSVQGEANRLVGNAAEQKKLFVRPIANTDGTPSVMWYLQRLISEIIDAISEGDVTLDALEIAVDKNTEDITDNAKQIDELQNTVADKQDKLYFTSAWDQSNPIVTFSTLINFFEQKQDNLTFDGMYSPTANPVATVRTVVDKLAEIIGNAPESLNTLEEIAAWIAAHPESIPELNALIAQHTQSIEDLQKRQSELIVKNIQQDGRFVDIEEGIAQLQYEDDVLKTNIEQNVESLSELRQEFENYVSGGGFGVDDETVKAIVEEETSPKFEEIESDITVIKRDLTNKQGTVSFDGDYNATTNKAATVATVSREIAKLVADAPEAFNTLEEIAKWIAKHPESVAQLNALIAQNAEAIAQLQETAVTKTNVEETVDSALEEAKASGEFDGYTPVKGVDYFTEADKAEIAAQAAAKVDLSDYAKTSDISSHNTSTSAHADIREEISKLSSEKDNYLLKNQGSTNVGKILVVGTDGNLTLADMPEGGASGDVVGVLDDANNILLTGAGLADGTYTLKFENHNGELTDLGELVVSSIVAPSYTNLAVISKTNGVGATAVAQVDWNLWCNDCRLGSDGKWRAEAGTLVTNYIPVKKGDVVRWKNLKVASGKACCCYKADKATITNGGVGYLADGSVWENAGVYTDLSTNGTSGQFTVGDTTYNNDIAYFRFGALMSGTDLDNVIITVNEPIG